MKYIRKILGAVILAWDALTPPRPMVRSEADQIRVDELTQGMSLYQFHSCPFCVKVRRHIRRLGLKIELRDARQTEFEQQLIEGGGKRKVPCLRIQKDGTDQWMYESGDINAYLQKKFG